MKYNTDSILSHARLAMLGSVQGWFLRSRNRPGSAHSVFPLESRTLASLTADSSESHAAASLSYCGNDSPWHVTNGHPDSVWGRRAQRERFSERRPAISPPCEFTISVLVASTLSRVQHRALVVTKVTAYWAVSAGA